GGMPQMADRFSPEDHARAQRAGRQAMDREAIAARGRRHPGWRFTFGWLALIQLIAVVAAGMNLFHPVSLNQATVGYLATWPVVVQPAWAGLVLAVLALLALATVWVRLGGGQGTGSGKPG